MTEKEFDKITRRFAIQSKLAEKDDNFSDNYTTGVQVGLRIAKRILADYVEDNKKAAHGCNQ